MKKILFVCLGNICRSPMAESIMNYLITKEKLQHRIHCDSAGTAGWHIGDKADRRMRIYAKERGYKITHLARQFSIKDFDNFDLIIGMDNQNIADIKSLARSNQDRQKILRMIDFVSSYEFDIIPDPYYGGKDDFLIVIDLLEDACSGLLNDLKK